MKHEDKYPGFPKAYARLRKTEPPFNPARKTGYYWEVPCCPYCGENHWHGAGDDLETVEDYLGPRVPHCLDYGYGRQSDYTLVRILRDNYCEPIVKGRRHTWKPKDSGHIRRGERR